MTTETYAASGEVSAIDTLARRPLFVLIGSSLFWLVVSGVLAIVNLVQLHSPSFLAACPWFTFGHTQAMQETAFVYGWAATAGLAVALWILGRLGGSPLRSINWAVFGAIFWNLGVLLGLIGIAIGAGTSIPFLRMPREVQPLLLFASAAIAVPGVLAWTGRRRDVTFASQWYAVAALFLFPWLYSAGQLMLLWAPVRGVLQAVTAGWFAQSLWSLWLAPLALTSAYYLVPKITGRTVRSYDFASLSFWTLIFVGSWTGGRHLIGGPVPAWISTIAVISAALMVFHYIVVALNLRGAGRVGGALRFVSFGVTAYVLGGILDAVTSMRGIARITQFTWFTQAQTQLALVGAFSMIIFGGIYFLVPRLTGRAWPSSGMIRFHYFGAVLGTLALVVGLGAAGLVQGRDLGHPGVTFAQIAEHTGSWLMVALLGQALLLLANLTLAIHFLRAIAVTSATVDSRVFRQPPAMEASAS